MYDQHKINVRLLLAIMNNYLESKERLSWLIENVDEERQHTGTNQSNGLFFFIQNEKLINIKITAKFSEFLVI